MCVLELGPDSQAHLSQSDIALRRRELVLASDNSLSKLELVFLDEGNA